MTDLFTPFDFEVLPTGGAGGDELDPPHPAEPTLAKVSLPQTTEETLDLIVDFECKCLILGLLSRYAGGFEIDSRLLDFLCQQAIESLLENEIEWAQDFVDCSVALRKNDSKRVYGFVKQLISNQRWAVINDKITVGFKAWQGKIRALPDQVVDKFDRIA